MRQAQVEPARSLASDCSQWQQVFDLLSLVGGVSAQIANVRDLDELACRVTALIQSTFAYYYVAIFTLEAGLDILHYRCSAGPGRSGMRVPGAEKPRSPALTIHAGEGIIGSVAQSGQEILANDIDLEPRYRYHDALPETRAEFALPLKIAGRVLGVLDVQSDQAGEFTETDQLVLRSLASSVAVAVEGTHLYSALHHRAEQLSTISEVSNAITSILDQEQLLNEVVHLIQKRFGYPYVHLFTIHPGRQKIFYEAGTGPRDDVLKEYEFSYSLDDSDGIIPWVARHGETVVANDVDSEPRYRHSALLAENTRSEMAVPLVFGGQVLGLLDIQSPEAGAFGDDDRFLFEALADNVAIALRNAYLYRSEKWRRQVADSLREVAGLLSADADLDQVLEAILIELERNLPCDISAVWLLEKSGSTPRDETTPALLWLAAAHGAVLSELYVEKGLHPDELVAINISTAERSASPGAPGLAQWLSEALAAPEPLIRAGGTHYEPLGAALGFPSDYSAIAAPLRVGVQHLGVLTLAHRTSGRYGSEAQAMTAAFASYAAVAIENTRLYEAAHEQAWVSTVLLQVAEATQSINNLNELLATVARIAPMLAGVKACTIYLLDEDEAFIPAASDGLSQEQQVEFERWRFAPGDVHSLDELLDQRHPVILDDLSSEPGLERIWHAPAGSQVPPGTEVFILIPLVAHGDVLGAFLFNHNLQLYNGAEMLEAVFDERLTILQGIAHQTATAAENIRLQKSQKEEAYVSVALLQVAQAVVSLNDLDDILGAIVRITPILVGVKRALIYLWDGAERNFRLVQAYGLPRSAAERRYTPAEFPFLETVHREDRLLAHPLERDGFGLGEVPEAWASLAPPGADVVDIYLQSRKRLLLAFPLTVKGAVLGVMLVEEPEALPVDNISGGAGNRRLRAKRLEITTGISQQAAMAVQNDLLQRQTMERERLEREMQLAREIQRSLLPQELPDLSGWELGALWCPARQMAGDFYDYFHLPGGRLGLVIADVADKGMPAALFMALVRTLMRATVYTLDTPVQVLERVNEVLLPDAQRGMYVTLIYAVLHPETGLVEWANAGHNPPFFFHFASGEVELLGKGGMALGVMEGSQSRLEQATLEEGDYLVFYTDGATETFSPNNEMFGEAGLQRTITACGGGLSAAALAEKIDQAVTGFTGDTALVDDLTLLVLRRCRPGGEAGA